MFCSSSWSTCAWPATAYARAAAQGVTVFASSGDTGSANVELNGSTFYPFPTVGFPASSPLVTAVGGTSLYASTSGKYQSETVWNNSIGAGGGGISQVFGEPFYQRLTLPRSDQRLLGGHRGLPDISWNTDPDTSILVYVSFVSPAGFYAIGGPQRGLAAVVRAYRRPQPADRAPDRVPEPLSVRPRGSPHRVPRHHGGQQRLRRSGRLQRHARMGPGLRMGHA